MELGKRIKQIIDNKTIVRDFFFFALVTLSFHFLYWHSDMNRWLFYPFNREVYSFFTQIAFKGTEFLSKIFINTSFDSWDLSLNFYHLLPNGEKAYFSTMIVSQDCSGLKQVFQLLMVILVVRGRFKKRMLYFLVSTLVVLFFNIVRIFLLTLTNLKFPNSYEFIHDWIGRPFHYIILTLIWIIWLECFQNKVNR